MKRIFFLAIAAFALFSCEKEIEIDLNSAEPLIVIEGVITDEPGPYQVKITQTVNFSEANYYPPVSGVRVIISDNTGVIDTLTETTPGIYQTQRITGVPGRTYSLAVKTETITYSATSTMPEKVNLDTLIFSPFFAPNSGDVYQVVPVFTDPVFKGNNYRIIQTVNGVVDGTYIIFNDNVNNGLVNERPVISRAVSIEQGDSVSIELRCIDESTYTYFLTLSQIAGDGPGGGTTPTNPPNNLSGGNVLGLFTAYTSQTITHSVK